MKPLLAILLLTTLASADQATRLKTFTLGLFAERDGQLKTARNTFEELLKKDPSAFPLALKTHQTQLRLNDATAATRTLRQFAETNRTQLPAQLSYANHLEQTAPHDSLAQQSALKTLAAANQNFPHNPAVFTPLINLYETTEQRPDSLALFQKQLNHQTENPAHWLALAPIAETLYPGGSEELAQILNTIYTNAEQTGLADPAIARRISEFHRNNNDLSQAIATLEKHLAESPASHSLRTRLGLLQRTNANDPEGEATLLQVLAI
ncbi:MAG: hypothetical protein AAGC74_14300, partial [Verrucomicrobiota bacterium]